MIQHHVNTFTIRWEQTSRLTYSTKYYLVNIFSATKIAKKLAAFIKILNREDVSKLKIQEKIIEVRWWSSGWRLITFDCCRWRRRTDGATESWGWSWRIWRKKGSWCCTRWTLQTLQNSLTVVICLVWGRWRNSHAETLCSNALLSTGHHLVVFYENF